MGAGTAYMSGQKSRWSAEMSHKNYSKDPFRFFKKTTLSIFEFLITDYGFKYVGTSVFPPECSVKYCNKTTGVTIYYEWGTPPMIFLTKLESNGKRIVESERHSIDKLIARISPEDSAYMDFNLKELTQKEIRKTLEEYAKKLKKYGRGILTGNFSIFQMKSKK